MPTMMQTGITTTTGSPAFSVSTAETAPTKAATEPTDRSIWPATMTSSMPSAITMI